MVARIEHILDFLYPPFSRLMNRLTFRYAACGGSNTVLDILLFFLSYHFIFRREVLHLPFVAISPHIAAFLLSFCITFPIGFLLNRYIVFKGSMIAGRIQLVRYTLTVCLSLLLNYFFLKLFVDGLGWYATPAKIVTTGIVIAFSYLSQMYFTFKVKEYG
jgi:putative flippase GtrA